jgi:cell division septal protein FtsQ
MPRFFYSASNLQNNHAPDSWWQHWRKKRERKRSLQRLDANLVEVHNPFKKNITEKSRSIKPGVAIVALLFFTWLGAMLCLPYFKIDKIEFTGLNIIKKEELNDFINTKFFGSNKNWWPTGNYFLSNSDKIKREIMNNFAVEDVSVVKVFPDSIKILIKEKTTSIIYDNGRDYVLLDENGNFVKKLKTIPENEFVVENLFNSVTSSVTFVTGTVAKSNNLLASTSTTSTTARVHKPNFKLIEKELGPFPLIYDRRIGKENKNNLEKEVVSAVLVWQKLLKGGEVGELQYFVLENLAAGLKINTSESWNILININGNYESAFNNLVAVIKENHPIEYVDLRYGERVYWR